eukprot:gene948-1200_t
MEEDDFGFGNIELIEDKVQERVNRIPIVEYSPKIHESIWFLNEEQQSSNNYNGNIIDNNLDEEKKKRLEKKLADKTKKASIKNAQYKIDHFYITGQYQECLDELNRIKPLVDKKKKEESLSNAFELKWLIEFKIESLKQQDDDNSVIEDRDENPFAL